MTTLENTVTDSEGKRTSVTRSKVDIPSIPTRIASEPIAIPASKPPQLPAKKSQTSPQQSKQSLAPVDPIQCQLRIQMNTLRRDMEEKDDKTRKFLTNILVDASRLETRVRRLDFHSEFDLIHSKNEDVKLPMREYMDAKQNLWEAVKDMDATQWKFTIEAWFRNRKLQQQNRQNMSPANTSQKMNHKGQVTVFMPIENGPQTSSCSIL